MENLPLFLQLLIYIIALGGGVFLLVKGGDWFVDAAKAIAGKFGLSPLVIGLTVVAIGTSLPELAVSTIDAITCLLSKGANNANVALGNVVGSNICNLLLILGISALIKPIAVEKPIRRRELPILLTLTGLTVLFVCFWGNGVVVNRWEAAILIVLLFAYFTYIVLSAKKKPGPLEIKEPVVPEPAMTGGHMTWLCILGLVGIVAGGELAVFGAKGLALAGAGALKINHDLTEALVGLTVVAVGTSLPELVVSIMAAKKGQNEMALGNVLGSNIFNILFVLGLSAMVFPLASGQQIIVDVLVMLWATVLVFLFGLSGKIRRWQGGILLACYVAYLGYLIGRVLVA